MYFYVIHIQRELQSLEELLLVGNPMYEGLTKEARRVEVIKRLPKLKKLDGQMVSEVEREYAMNGGVPPPAQSPTAGDEKSDPNSPPPAQ